MNKRSPSLGMIDGLPERFGRDFALEIFKRGNFCRHFELQAIEARKRDCYTIPVYFSLGTEFNAAVFSVVLEGYKVFAQHRCHSLYLCFGGDPVALRDELMGLPTGCCHGMSGSNAIHIPGGNMYGHSGLMGEQVPIACGAAYASREPCLSICGDASVEEDYIYPSLGWAVSEKLPVVFICEDNDLSILTKVEVRRNWSPVDVAKGLGMEAVDITDDPWLIAYHLERGKRDLPVFLNIRCVRHTWHNGAGKDGEPEWNRYELVLKSLRKLGLEREVEMIDRENFKKAREIWEPVLDGRIKYGVAYSS